MATGESQQPDLKPKTYNALFPVEKSCIGVLGDEFYGWFESPPKPGDLIFHRVKCGSIGVFQISRVRAGHDEETYYGRVKFRGLSNRMEPDDANRTSLSN